MKSSNILPVFSSAAAVVALVAGFILLRTPEGPFLDSGAICSANRENVGALKATLLPAPVMSLEMAKRLVNDGGAGLVLKDSLDGDGTKILRWLDDQGRPHRKDAPAIIVFDPVKKRVVMEVWAHHGLMHRLGGKPASTAWDPDTGLVTEQTWREMDKIHNATGPALRIFDWAKHTLTQSWHLDNDVKRPDGGPTYTRTNMLSGIVVFEEWASRFGMSRLMHRADGIHQIEHDPETGIPTRKLYRLHDMKTHSDEVTFEVQMHRKTGVVVYEEWKKNGVMTGYARYNPEGIVQALHPDQKTIDFLRAGTGAMQEAGGHHDHHGGHREP